MGGPREHIDGLTRLHKLATLEEQRAAFRHAFASLAAVAAENAPVPLEGLDPVALRDATRVALRAGFFDDLGWLAPASAHAATYELAAVLPAGDEKRELGRRTLRALHDGNAAVFTMLATQLATGSRRGLSGPAIRARVALALDLPIGRGVRADALALALIARKDLAEDWLVAPSTGSLPSRRLAARLLERAAREAARRASAGDSSVLRVFERDSVVAASARLLADREPLVWRHVASARGLLAEAIPRLEAEIDESLHESLTPTEWRRGAASLATTIALDPALGTSKCEALLSGPLMARDAGIAAAMVLGLARAAEVEPDAVEALLQTLVRDGGLDAIEALHEIRAERVGSELGEWAARLALIRLRDDGLGRPDGDDGHFALLRAIDADLRSREERPFEVTLRERLEDAKAAFIDQDARSAYAAAQDVLAAVLDTLARLEAGRDDTQEARCESFTLLRQLDATVLESSALADLLQLGAGRGEAGGAAGARSLDACFARLTTFVLDRERDPVRDPAAIVHPTLRQRRLRTLLHLVDVDGSHLDERTPELRERRIRTANFLLGRTRDDAPSPLRRVVAAGAARACDALLREEVGELSDVLLAAAWNARTEHDLVTLAEASMVPEAAAVFRAYASVIERTQRTARVTDTRAIAGLEALKELARQMPGASSPRVEALRRALRDSIDALDALAEAASMSEVTGSEDAGSPSGSLLASLGAATEQLARLVAGAMRRLGQPLPDEQPAVVGGFRFLELVMLRAIRKGQEGAGVVPSSSRPSSEMERELADAMQTAIEALREDLPVHLAEVAAGVLVRVISLPRTGQRRSRPPRISLRGREAALPPWMPPGRTLGGFYVLRALGSGAVGSVFVARRAEERGNDRAPRFALKVPEYGGSVARTLSEAQFLQMFREEAGALLAVPPHENLARLVTFDVGARPKPILVMELVEGATLERRIETGSLDLERGLHLLDGIAAGLGTLHAAGLGHLDLKPSNVILRDPDGPGPGLETAVLVDFGLAGRTVRPGCATASYGAPEVWGLVPAGHVPQPAPADVYAFACVAFESLTGKTLFDGPSDLAVVGAHLQHDGELPALASLAHHDRRLTPLVQALADGLRQDPRRRPPIAVLRQALASAAPVLRGHRWPLPAVVG